MVLILFFKKITKKITKQKYIYIY